MKRNLAFLLLVSVLSTLSSLAAENRDITIEEACEFAEEIMNHRDVDYGSYLVAFYINDEIIDTKKFTK